MLAIQSLTNDVIVRNKFDEFCNYCIRIMEEMSRMSGISYGEINVWLFVIIQPALILLFMATTVYLLITLKRNRKGKCSDRERVICTGATTIIVVICSLLILAILGGVVLAAMRV